jgi:hypothetical protein
LNILITIAIIICGIIEGIECLICIRFYFKHKDKRYYWDYIGLVFGVSSFVIFCCVGIIINWSINWNIFVLTTELGTYSELTMPKYIETYYTMKAFFEVEWILLILISLNIVSIPTFILIIN